MGYRALKKYFLVFVVLIMVFQSIESVSAINAIKIEEKYNSRNEVVSLKENKVSIQ